MPIINARAFELDYFDVGSGPPVILLHSSASGNQEWRRLTDRLKDRYRLVGINLFGYGATTPWRHAAPQTLRDQAELVAAAAAMLPKPVMIVGHSLGAAVGMEAAMSLRGLVRTLILFEPIPFYLLAEHGPPEAFAEIRALATRFRAFAAAGEWTDAGALFLDYWSGRGTWAALPEDRQEALLQIMPNVVHEWAAVMSVGRPLLEWAAIGTQVNVIHAADTRVPTRILAGLLTHTHQWRSHVLPAGGHMAPVTRPEEVNLLIASLLDHTPR